MQKYRKQRGELVRIISDQVLPWQNLHFATATSCLPPGRGNEGEREGWREARILRVALLRCRANDARRLDHQSYFHYANRSCSALTPRGPRPHCYYSQLASSSRQRPVFLPRDNDATGAISDFMPRLCRANHHSSERSRESNWRNKADDEDHAWFLLQPANCVLSSVVITGDKDNKDLSCLMTIGSDSDTLE